MRYKSEQGQLIIEARKLVNSMLTIPLDKLKLQMHDNLDKMEELQIFAPKHINIDIDNDCGAQEETP